MEINEQIKQMAMRLRGLREDLDMTVLNRMESKMKGSHLRDAVSS